MIRVLSLFSGIGAFEKALERLGIEHEVVNYCEIDPYAGKAYSLIHNISQEKNLVDVTNVDTSKLENIDLVTYGFPCVDISIAGHMKGFEDEDGNRTRSGLFFEALRIIQDTKPKYAIAENVKNLMSKSFERELDIVLNSLGSAGYNTYCKVLNAKDYGIPQNRERVFIVSIRRDVDDFSFDFPKSKPLDLKLKDLLELDPDEKYFLAESQMARMKINNKNALIYDCSMIGYESHAREHNDIMPTITAREYKDPRIVNHSKLHNEVIQIGNVCPSKTRDNPNQGRVYDDNGLSPSLTTMQGGHRQPFIVVSRGMNGVVVDADGLERTIATEKGEGQKILIKENTKQGFAEAYEGDSINLEQPNSKTRRGRVGHGVAQTLTTSPQQAVVIKDKVKPKLVGGIGEKKLGNQYRQGDRIYDSNAIAMCLTAQPVGNAGGNSYLYAVEEPKFRIRKLTPKECFRLMGFDDKDIDVLIENGISNTQLYKMAGNSIVVDVLERLFECLLLKKKEEPDLFSMMFEI